jgi:ribosomal protein S18 acetylase RimI-like enzyme
MAIQIIRANENDSETIARILIASWRLAYKNIMPDDLLDNLSVDQRKSRWEHHFCNGGEAYLLWDESSICGLVEVCQFRDKIDGFTSYGEIPVLYLMPDKIGCGFGSMLMKFALSLLAGRRMGNVGIWVLEKNTRAINFYEKHGFLFSGHTKTHGPTGLVEWLMIRAE